MPTVLVLYHSQEAGNTLAMAQAIAQGARGAKADVRLINTNDQRADVEVFRAAHAVAFGSPDYYSYIAGGLKMFLDDWHIAKGKNALNLSGKAYGLFYSHGGGGKVKGVMESLFKSMGQKVGSTVESKGRPDDPVLRKCRDLGAALAKSAIEAEQAKPE